MSAALPPQLAQMMGGQGDQEPQDELGALQDVLQDLHRVVTVLKSPQDTEQAIQCMKILAGIQTRLMGQNGSAQPPR